MIGAGVSLFEVALRGQAVAPPVTHTITASAGAHGSISPTGSVSVNDGADQAFTFSADTGYYVLSVTVDGSPVSTTSPYTFTNVTADHTIAVAFALSETVVVTPLGTVAFTSASATITKAGVTVAAGSTLLVTLAWNRNSTAILSGIAFNGVSCAEVSTRTIDSYGLNQRKVVLYELCCASAVTGDVVATFDTESPSAAPTMCAMIVAAATGLTTDAADKTSTAEGSSTSPASGYTGTLTQAHELAVGSFEVNGLVGDSDGGYGTSHQRQAAGTSTTTSVVASMGFVVVTADTSLQASKTITSRLWGAMVATFKAA